jgi:hypothetical protein
MPATELEITDRNHAEVMAQLERIGQNVDRLLKIWDEHGHILVAWQRGGMLAARTAAKRGRNGAVP